MYSDCTVGGSLNSRRATSPLVSFVEVKETWEAPNLVQGILSHNWGGTQPKHNATCMDFKTKDNDKDTSSLLQ
ncbi:hypothetical protein TNCV_4065931 [Trichonephila clavipes]|uniref:Uncharacterized protein n=1 Tax=Trichonephila clavipes TaxID=2585209 RepID=A0A8X6W8Q0_TRICX|nr:hypothetical protein TNCV_4065931 [Trichonephila clavipes]